MFFISGDVLNLFAAERPQQFHQVCWQKTSTLYQISFDPQTPSASLRVEQVRREGDRPAASRIPGLPQAWVEASQSHQLQAKRLKNKEVRGSLHLVGISFPTSEVLSEHSSMLWHLWLGIRESCLDSKTDNIKAHNWNVELQLIDNLKDDIVSYGTLEESLSL